MKYELTIRNPTKEDLLKIIGVDDLLLAVTTFDNLLRNEIKYGLSDTVQKLSGTEDVLQHVRDLLWSCIDEYEVVKLFDYN